MNIYFLVSLLSLSLVMGCAKDATSSPAPQLTTQALKCSSYAPCAKACRDMYPCNDCSSEANCSLYVAQCTLAKDQCLSADLPNKLSANVAIQLNGMALISEKPSWYDSGQAQAKDYEYNENGKFLQICDAQTECAIFIRFE